jgi:predicted amidophosphoribosyltransferase
MREEVPPFCLKCGRTLPCGTHPQGERCFAAARHSGFSKKAVHFMKYSGGKRTALMMGELMARRFGRPDADFLVPVPLHKFSDRDYNQAELIARGAGKIWNIRTVPVLKWKLLVPRQALKSGSGGRILPDDAMIAAVPIARGRIFIVDDVYTSGSTIAAASAALEKAGAVVTGAMVWSRGGTPNGS